MQKDSRSIDNIIIWIDKLRQADRQTMKEAYIYIYPLSIYIYIYIWGWRERVREKEKSCKFIHYE